MKTGAGIDALDPEGSHVTLLVAAIAVGILQRLLHALPRDPYAVLCASSETLCQLEDFVLVHLLLFSPSLLSTDLKP